MFKISFKKVGEAGRIADQYLGCPYAPPSGQLPPDADVYSKSDQAVKS